ncbi:MAG: uracil phosphoribosyltransferase [Elusimicrobia bacterium]|nr:uracil phosphoribosyltransferase [Elusimicrobiota bacterium]
MKGVHLVRHPILGQHVAELRSKKTESRDFRWHLKEAARILLLEALAGAPVKSAFVETPLAKTKGLTLAMPVVLVAILRAGLGMVDGMAELLPDAILGHIGLFRDERTLKPVHYYSKIPNIAPGAWTFLVDPMLATGGSAVYAVDLLRKHGAKTVKMISLIASQAGVDILRKAHPNVDLYVAAVDKVLNDNGYIVPGLGDCGDRLFSTL